MTELELFRNSGAKRQTGSDGLVAATARIARRTPLTALIIAGAVLFAGAQTRALDAGKAAAPGAGGEQVIQIATKSDGGTADLGPLHKLQAAALDGSAQAQWTLARMYAEGDGVPASQLKAFEYFRMLANQHADDSPLLASARYVSDSFIRLADYYRTGIVDSEIVQNAGLAINLLRHAATYFGDPEAQYRLGRIYLEGEGVKANAILAAKWLMLAARKGNVAAQADLGALLITGGKGLRAQPRRGLMFLEMARRGADPVAQAWVIESRDRHFAGADPALATLAIACADNWPSSSSCAH